MPAPAITYSTTVQFAAYMQLGGSTLMLTGGNTTGDQSYSGSLLSGGTPFDLKTFADEVLGGAFGLTLPSSFPTITIDHLQATVSGKYTPATTSPAAPEKTVWSYVFEAASTTSVDKPFGDSVPMPVSFDGFSVAVTSGAGTAGTALYLSTTVNSNLTWLRAMMPVTGKLVLTSGCHAVGFFINGTINTGNLLADLFGCTVPADLAEFLPTFAPPNGGQMRLYYANNAINTTQGGVTYCFNAGFNFDQCIVSLLGLDFSISLQFQNSNSYSFGASVSALDLGILQIRAPTATVVPNPGLGGPVVQVQRSSGSTMIDLQADLVFFNGADAVSLDLSAGYTAATKTFSGSITYIGSMLGIHNPSLAVTWNQTDGLQFKDFPIPSGMLAQFIAFEKELKEILNNKPGNTCAKLVDFVFSKAITTKFKLNVKPTSSNGSPGLSIGGVYSVWVTGYDVCDITFAPFVATVSIPKSFDDLGNAIVQTLTDNATKLVQALVDDKDAFCQFLAVQGLQSGASALAALACNAGGDAAADAVGDAAAAAADAAAGGAADTLADAAAVFAAATAALSFFDKILKCMTDSQKKQRDQAQANQAAAESKIQQLLSITGLAAHYTYGAGGIGSVARWNNLNITDPAANLTLNLSLNDATLFETTLAIGQTTFDPPTALQAGQNYQLTLCGHYLYNGHRFDGVPVTVDVAVGILSIESPSVTYDPAANSISANWATSGGFTTPDMQQVSVSHYSLQLWDAINQGFVAGMSATVAGSAASLTHAFSLLPTAPPYFVPVAGNSYQVQLQAVANLAAFSSAVWKSAPFSVGTGIGHTLVGKSFKVR